ncbi:MAG: zinc ribbon domain-containing protein, partial [Methanomicrobiales archaeon]
MLCPNCETEVPDGSFFCAECGADIIHDGDGAAADDACRAVFDGDPSFREEDPPLAAGGVGDDRHGEEAEEMADAGPWADEDTVAAPSAEETVRVFAGSEDLKKCHGSGPDAAAGDLRDDLYAEGDGTQGDGYAAIPAPTAGDGEPAEKEPSGPLSAADGEEQEQEQGRGDEDDLRLGAEADDDAATVDEEFVPVTEDDADAGEAAADDDGRIRIREGGRSGPRRRVPTPYDPMEDLMADSPPEPPAEAGETPPKRPFTMPQLPVIAGAAAV